MAKRKEGGGRRGAPSEPGPDPRAANKSDHKLFYCALTTLFPPPLPSFPVRVCILRGPSPPPPFSPGVFSWCGIRRRKCFAQTAPLKSGKLSGRSGKYRAFLIRAYSSPHLHSGAGPREGLLGRRGGGRRRRKELDIKVRRGNLRRDSLSTRRRLKTTCTFSRVRKAKNMGAILGPPFLPTTLHTTMGQSTIHIVPCFWVQRGEGGRGIFLFRGQASSEGLSRWFKGEGP